MPNIKGKELKNILKVRKTQDVIATMENLKQLQNIVVLGGGYIGLEFAVSLNNMGKTVTLIELQPHVMGNRMDDNFAKAVENHLEKLGITVLTNEKAVEFVGKEKVESVLLESGKTVKADAVLSAVGVRPLIEYAKNFGLKTSKDGITVNEYFETNVSDIYAIGDCVETKSFITKKPTPGKLGSNAGQMARLLALNFNGIKKPYEGVINAAVTCVNGLSIGSAGISEKEALNNGYKVVTGFGKSFSAYNNMPHHKEVFVKVIYDKDTLKLLGAEIMGEFNPAGFIEVAATQIQQEADLYHIISSHYSSHPELTPKTSHPFLVFASEEVLKKIVKK
jgi:pyruvate/2-oxoglutarate dehydrogenase complex dihydrolipoamide dehydrogenase (E3) component